MTIWEKTEIINDSGEKVSARMPLIVSASRATDIPAFYGDWFIDRLNRGFVKRKNPFSGLDSYISFAKTRFIVFWSKNYEPFLKHLKILDDRNINYYFQFTLNDYDSEGYEPFVPTLKTRIETFKRLVDFSKNPNKVVWRFDPLFLTDKTTVEQLLEKIENIGNQLKGYTNKLVISFADIKNYKKVETNLKHENIHYSDWTSDKMEIFACGLQELNRNLNYVVGTCAEDISLEKYGIIHNKCIDDELIVKLSPTDKIILDFLGVVNQQQDIFNQNTKIIKKRNLKDKGQRKQCACIFSADIGEYNTCPHGCVYCYANEPKRK